MVAVARKKSFDEVLVTTASDEEAVRLPPFELDIDVRRLWTSSKPE